MGGHARAFGLDVIGDIETLGLPPAPGPGTDRRTHVEIVTEPELDAGWPARGARRLMGLGQRGDAWEQSIDIHPEAGFRLFARDVGVAVVAPRGERVVSASAGPVGRVWRRFLVGRMLPLAAVLQGLEIFHASAVVLGDRVFGFVGPSGVGKTSLAARLVLGGAEFYTDDVLALDAGGDRVRAHPGAASMAVRAAEYEHLSEDDRRRLGTLADRDGKSFLILEPRSDPLPVGGLYYLHRSSGDSGVSIERQVSPPSPMLLGSSFLPSVATPERLAVQLAVCARLAGEVPINRVTIPPTVDAAELAARVADHAASLAEAEV